MKKLCEYYRGKGESVYCIPAPIASAADAVIAAARYIIEEYEATETTMILPSDMAVLQGAVIILDAAGEEE